jgi:AraC family transcriptional regulator, positive regulator of tynA and feaB
MTGGSSSSAAASSQLVRLSSAFVPQNERSEWFEDEVGRRLTSARPVTDTAPGQFKFEWAHLELADIAVGQIDMRSARVERTVEDARDGEDGITLFMPTGPMVRFDQSDNRNEVTAGQTVLLRHDRAARSWWTPGTARLIKIPRHYLAHVDIDKLAGTVLADTTTLRLLWTYAGTLFDAAAAGEIAPTLAQRHVAELAAATLAAPLAGHYDARLVARAGAIRDVIARRYAEPGLNMAAVAMAVGCSERSAYAALAAEQVRFADLLIATRLDRARELLAAFPTARIIDIALRSGFTDLSHFNRRFRERFDVTPGDWRTYGRKLQD